LNFISKPAGQFIDRRERQPDLESIDVLMATLDSDTFLERCLFTIYQEIPIKNLIVCDGGSKDETINILKKFPRVEIHDRPDIRTGGKIVEFLISKSTTEWFAFIDSDIELSNGWYDEMKKFQNDYDVIENSNEMIAFNIFRPNKVKLEENQRSYDVCHLMKKEALKDYHCEDDFMLRHTDYLVRQTVEKSGYKYGKVSSTMHVNNETEKIKYQSDNEKNYSKFEWKEPELVIFDKKKEKIANEKHAKSIVKYLDPENACVKSNRGIFRKIKNLDRNWVKNNGPQWLNQYDKSTSTSFKLKLKLNRFLNKRTE